MKEQQSKQLFIKAQELIPGGVNSPVRAFKAVGRHPFFVESDRGPWIIDVDGNKYLDYVCSWGPGNQLYPDLLEELAEEFRLYTNDGGQVFVSTHSPDFLNAVQLSEIYYLEKKNGFTTICKASDNSLVKSLCEAGELPGALWKQGLLAEE